MSHAAPLSTVLREWGRIGCIGFGGPPAHIKLLRELCLERRGWMEAQEFEDAIAACNLLPGPASTQLAIYCGWRVRGRLGAVVGGLAFIVPGLILILLLASVLLVDHPNHWVRAAGAGAGAAVAAVAVQAGFSLIPASWRRSREQRTRVRWIAYAAVGAIAAAGAGAFVVVAILACGAIEMVLGMRLATAPANLPVVALRWAGGAALGPLLWVALKVGALSYGGGFVIVPLMQADAVGHYHWLTSAGFLNAVALGQITPGPVVLTVAAVGFAAAGIVGALLAATTAFAPSFLFILLGAHRFDRLRADAKVRAFLNGAGPAAIGAILGAAIPLTSALTQPWQYVVLGGAAVLLLLLRRGPMLALLLAALAGVVAVALGGALPVGG